MPTILRPSASVLLILGDEELAFLDGLSTNSVKHLKNGDVTQTVFTDSKAKVMDHCYVLKMENFSALVGYNEHKIGLIEHLTKKILTQNISISDITDDNDVWLAFNQESNIEIGKFLSNDGITTASIELNLQLIIAGKKLELNFTDATEEQWKDYRIDNLIPEAPYEVTDSNHPLAMGLENCIGIDKGCYIGQEIITRMQTRGRQGKKLMRLEGNYEEGGKIEYGIITSAGTNAALAIVRANYIP